MRFRFTTPRVILALASVGIAFSLSCDQDQLTPPQANGIGAPTHASRDLTGGEAPAEASATVQATGINTMPGATAEIGFYPDPTVVEVQAAQAITINSLNPPIPGGFLPLAGDHCGGGQAFVWSSGFVAASFAGCVAGSATTWTDTVPVWQDVTVGHDSFALV